MRSFRRGVVGALPLVPGVVAFGFVYGMTARAVGFSLAEAAGMSAIVHAGSAQFVALGMWASSSVGAILLMTLVINLRHLLMGASVARYLRGLSLLWKVALALWMSDESYGAAVSAYQRGIGDEKYFLGANVCIWIAWWPAGLAGAWVGGAVPDLSRYGLDMVFPLAFMGLASTFLKGASSGVAALTAAVFAVAGAHWLPGNWGLLAAGVLGASLGWLVERRQAA